LSESEDREDNKGNIFPVEEERDLCICSTCRHNKVCGIQGYDLRECAYYGTDLDGDDVET
jgi:hypothetical protein